MDDKKQIEQLYQDMYAAMVKKDEAELDRVHDDTFVLIHMTGVLQSKSTMLLIRESIIASKFSLMKTFLVARLTAMSFI